jgi:type IV secretion system protein VirB6
MPEACSAPDAPGLVAGLLADTDCQAFGLVERGYAALASPQSATAATLTTMMVIAVAFFGYQLMLGRGLALADLTRLAVRLGIVLLLATSWGMVQGVVYDTVARAPTRVAEELITSIDAPAPLAGIQSALDKIEQASIGWRQRAGIASPLVGGPPTTAMTLNVAAFLLTMTTLGLLVVSRIVLALLLALTPVVAGFLLFDTTRGLLEGWLRALIAAALVPLGVLTLAAVELAIVMPILDRILVQEAAGQYLETSVTPLGLVTIVFSIALLFTLAALRSIARGIRLPGQASAPARGESALAMRSLSEPGAALQAERAARNEGQPGVVRALESLQRRDIQNAAPPPAAAFARTASSASAGSLRSRQTLPGPGRPEGLHAVTPPLRRPLRNRASRAAKRRDL